jgi:heme A synthase
MSEKKHIKKDLSFTLIISSLLVGILFSFSTIYYALFSFNNLWFDITEVPDIAHLPFEFIYFTFTVTITYSGSGIVASGVVPKIVQMIHILLFYLYFADVVMTLLKKDE